MYAMLYDGWRGDRLYEENIRQSKNTWDGMAMRAVLLSAMVGLTSCQQTEQKSEQPPYTLQAPTVLNTAEAHPLDELTILVPPSNLSGNSTLIQVAENSTRVIQVQAKGTPGAQLSYRLQSGEDIDKFMIDEKTGELTFRDVPDWEMPTDENKDNNYLVTWQAVSSSGSARSQLLIVKVADLED
ncbi:MAG: cadherin repeat domain-containing protein [Cyanobacteria bacterium J06634_6]